MLTTALL